MSVFTTDLTLYKSKILLASRGEQCYHDSSAVCAKHLYTFAAIKGKSRRLIGMALAALLPMKGMSHG